MSSRVAQVLRSPLSICRKRGSIYGSRLFIFASNIGLVAIQGTLFDVWMDKYIVLTANRGAGYSGQ